MLTRLRSLVHHLNHAKMSTASGVHNTNVACCTLPAVKSDYKPKGTYKPYGGFQKVMYTHTHTKESRSMTLGVRHTSQVRRNLARSP